MPSSTSSVEGGVVVDEVIDDGPAVRCLVRIGARVGPVPVLVVRVRVDVGRPLGLVLGAGDRGVRVRRVVTVRQGAGLAARERLGAARPQVRAVLVQAEVDERAPADVARHAAGHPDRQAAEADVERHVRVDEVVAEQERDPQVADARQLVADLARDVGARAERGDDDVVDRHVAAAVQVQDQIGAVGAGPEPLERRPGAVVDERLELLRDLPRLRELSSSPFGGSSTVAVICSARAANGVTTSSLKVPTMLAPASSVSPTSGMLTPFAAPSSSDSSLFSSCGRTWSSRPQLSAWPSRSACSPAGSVGEHESGSAVQVSLSGSVNATPATSTLRTPQASPVEAASDGSHTRDPGPRPGT